MKRYTIFLVLFVALLLSITISIKSSASSNPYTGHWTGIDDADSSHLTMWIVEEARSGGKVFAIRQYDDQTGPWCGGGPAEMKTVGVHEEENSIEVMAVWWCLDTSVDPGVIAFEPGTLTYDPTNDTITETISEFTNIYTRTP
jgi:hypothetical protein